MNEFLLRKHFAPISVQQKGVGSAAVPASCCAVQHEGEKHQKGPDSHPQNQPEPRASREKSKQLSPSFFALANVFLTHMHTLIPDAIS